MLLRMTDIGREADILFVLADDLFRGVIISALPVHGPTLPIGVAPLVRKQTIAFTKLLAVVTIPLNRECSETF